MGQRTIIPELNVVTQLLAFVLIASVVGQAKSNMLEVVFCLLFIANALYKQSQFFKLARKLRWFFIVMWLIYAFNTPGEYWQSWPFTVAPTLEGMQAGLLQLVRILIMISAISIILASNTREQLISGFCFILKPLKWLGVDTERFAARLWLTLHYVETQPGMVQGQHFLDFVQQTLSEVTSDSEKEQMYIQWLEPAFSYWDMGVILSMMCLILFLAGV